MKGFVSERGQQTSTLTETCTDDNVPAPALDDASLNYDVQSEHARGGLGRVLRAWDRRLRRTVAIKELLTARGDSELRFVREVEITAQLQHPSVVPVYEAGRWPNGMPFFAMKFVGGRSMRQVIDATQKLDERLALLPNVLAVADAISYAHNSGIIHRDLKPSNVMIGDFGETIVIDWGLAKNQSELSTKRDDVVDPYRSASQTALGTVMGTPSYMPPEQAGGHEVDSSADIYALGALLYHVLAGKPPFAGDNASAVLEQVLAGPPERVENCEPAVPPDLAAIVGRAMARLPDARYATAQELADDLRRFQTGQLVRAHRYNSATLFRRWLRRHRPTVIATLLLVALMTVALAFTVRRIVLERNLAQSERALAEQRALSLTLTQARTSLNLDPTRALAWLKKYPSDSPGQEEVRSIAADAMSRGVARLVLHRSHKVSSAVLAPDGMEIVAGGDSSRFDVWNTNDASVSERDFKTTFSLCWYSPDGHVLIAAGDNGRLAMFDRQGTRRDLAGHHGSVLELAFSPDSRTFLTRDDRDSICLWDLSEGICLSRPFPYETVQHIAYRADGTPLLIVARGREIEVLDARGPSRLARLTAPSKITYLAPTVHGDTIVARAGDRLYVWHDFESKPVASFASPPGRVAVRVTSDGSRIAVTSFDQSLDLFDLETETTRHLVHPHRVQLLTFSPDDRLLAVGMTNGAVMVHDLIGGDTQLLLGHEAAVSALQFSSDSRELLSAGTEDRTVRLWHLRLAERVFQAGGAALINPQFSPDGARLSVTGDGGSMRVWNISDGRLLWAPHNDSHVASASFSADGNWVAAASWDRTIKWKNLKTSTTGVLTSENPVQRVVWLDDGKTLATGSTDGSIDRWDIASGVHVLLARHDGPITRLAVSPDGLSLLSSSDDGTIRLSAVADGRSRIVGRQSNSVVAQFLPDGRSFVSAGEDGTVKVRSVATGESRLLRLNGAALSDLAVASDGEHIAAGSIEGVVYVWSLLGKEPRLFHADQGHITDVEFSTDGRFVAASGYNHTACLWSLATGALAELRGHDGPLNDVAFSTDGTWLATSGDDSTVRLWAIDKLSWIPSDRDRFREWIEHATNLRIENQTHME